MNKNKKISLGLTAGAFLFAFISIFMGFANGITQTIKWAASGEETTSTYKFFDVIFNKNNYVKDYLGGKSNAGLIIMFVLTLIAILTLATLLIMNLAGKGSCKLNKGFMIASAVMLMVLFLLAICSKAICIIPDEDKYEVAGTLIWTATNKLGAGPICWCIFSLIGGVAMIVATKINKKAWTQA